MPRQKRQPFYFFMLDVQKKHRDRGKHYSLREMPSIASPLWSNMSKEEKKRYEDMAKAHNASEAADAANGLNIKTCHGIDYSQVQKDKRQEESEKQRSKRNVLELINNAIVAKRLATKNFFLIHVNYFCAYKGSDGEEKFAAAELAILEFSLADGLGRGMHTLIKLDSLPYGYAFEAQRHSGETHDLPLPPDTKGNTIRDAVIAVIEFVNTNDEDMGSPIFTHPDHISVVKSIFEDVLSMTSYEEYSKSIDVYSLSDLLFHLKNASHEQSRNKVASVPFASVYLAETYLERGSFDFSVGLPCDFHEDNDRVQHCSQTKIRGWAYSIMESCVRDLGIDFIEGKHAPMNAMSSAPQFKIADDESVFTTTDFASEIAPSGVSYATRYTSPWSVAPSDHFSRDASTAASVNSLFNVDDFPLMRDLKRTRLGKGRGNLL